MKWRGVPRIGSVFLRRDEGWVSGGEREYNKQNRMYLNIE
jgi:hypothetical protein